MDVRRLDAPLEAPRKPARKPLQFQRGTAQAFRKTNPILLDGQPAVELDTMRLKIGDGKHRYNQLPYIGDHSRSVNGKSAYELWIDAGNTGTLDDFLASCVGQPGKSTYELWLSLGNEGTMTEFIQSLGGKSAYQLWVAQGNSGTISDYLASLNGKSAYEIWLNLGNTGNEGDFIASLKGEKGDSAYQVWLANGNTGTEEEFLESLIGKSAYEVWLDTQEDKSQTIYDYIEFMTTTSWGGF